MRRFVSSFEALAIIFGLFLLPAASEAQSLRGSESSLDRQNRQARAHDFTYLTDAAQVRHFASTGRLVALRANQDFELKDVSFAYARPAVRLFVQRLSAQFRAACGEKLVVTSLTRPRSTQPRNASARSVHPTGMAVDLRRHNKPACRRWLDRVLLSLEVSRVLEVTLERHPPHYHVAVFPDPYSRYVARIEDIRKTPPARFADLVSYTVGRKDTLWRIARQHGTTPERIQAANGLTSTTIYPGQTLQVPLSTLR